MDIEPKLMEAIMLFFKPRVIDLEEAYMWGYDCGIHGADLNNCHIKIFQSEAHQAAWNEGRADESS
jgi:ribosome modulation factor